MTQGGCSSAKACSSFSIYSCSSARYIALRVSWSVFRKGSHHQDEVSTAVIHHPISGQFFLLLEVRAAPDNADIGDAKVRTLYVHGQVPRYKACSPTPATPPSPCPWGPRRYIHAPSRRSLQTQVRHSQAILRQCFLVMPSPPTGTSLSTEKRSEGNAPQSQLVNPVRRALLDPGANPHFISPSQLAPLSALFPRHSQSDRQWR